MAAPKVTVVISQAQGKNPAKLALEETIATQLMLDPEIEVSLVPHLYDMQKDHTGLLFLRSISGPLIVLSWLYPRGAQWILDRQGIKGQSGTVLLKGDEEDEPQEELEDSRGIGAQGRVPNRNIYCIDLRATSDADLFLDEIRRIANEHAITTVDLLGGLSTNRLSGMSNGFESPAANAGAPSEAPPKIEESTKRRWYPVIDYSRCTNCMECIDFCLFGVYGVDQLDTIIVEQQDSCKKGCPACSRICPENAIIFPQHKTPSIAGASGEVASLKIDLSKLFGGPGADAVDLAVAERDAELMKDGRDAVGASVGLNKSRVDRPRDELDELMDGLDALNF